MSIVVIVMSLKSDIAKIYIYIYIYAKTYCATWVMVYATENRGDTNT